MSASNRETMINVEVVYAHPHRHQLISLILPAGSTVGEAIEASGIVARFPDVDPGGANKIGIYGKLCKPDAELRDRDRVEIYRPLIADPKAVRKKRAEEGKAMKKGGGDATAEGADPAAG